MCHSGDWGCSASKGCWLSGVLVVILCRAPGLVAAADTRASPAETWVWVSALCPSLPRQILQLMPSALLLMPALVVDEPSLNQLWESPAMLRLLGVTASKSTLPASQGRAGKGDWLLLLMSWWEWRGWCKLPCSLPWAHFFFFFFSFTRKSTMELVPSHPDKTSLCAHGSRAATRPDPVQPAEHLGLTGTHRPPASPGKCDGIFACWQAGWTGGHWSQLNSFLCWCPGYKCREGNILQTDAGCTQQSSLNTGSQTPQDFWQIQV